jgi:polysaccharide biosynthesis protein PslG
MRCVLRVQAVDPELGFNDNAIRAGQVSAEEDAVLTERVGAGIHRVAFDWRYVEPDPDRYFWGDYDRIYAAMLERGIRPLFVLIYAPDWARELVLLCGSDCRAPPARERLRDWREIAGLVAARYPRLAGIEIWNEPNETTFWEPAPDVARYAELLVEAYGAVKAANPAMPVVTGGFANRRTSGNGDVSLREFLEGVYANGGGGRFDALGFHPYPGSLAFQGFDQTFDEVRAIASRHGDESKPLWVTETGFTTRSVAERPRVSEQEQAAGIVDLYRRLKAQRDVRAIVFHTLLDPAVNLSGADDGFGLLRPDSSPKPAYCALAMEVRSLRACP